MVFSFIDASLISQLSVNKARSKNGHENRLNAGIVFSSSTTEFLIRFYSETVPFDSITNEAHKFNV